MEDRYSAAGQLWPIDGRALGSPWRAPTLALWAVSRLLLFLNVVALKHPCDLVFWQYGNCTVLGVNCTVPNAHGHHLLPYRDYTVEYPPLAAALFMIPGFLRDHIAYAAGFALVMLVADALTLQLVRVAARRLRLWSDGWQAAFSYTILSLATFAILPKFDLLPGTLTLLAVLFLARGYDRAAWVALAASVLFKGYAVVLIPLFLLYRDRVDGRRGWWHGPLAGLAASAAVIVPLFLLDGLKILKALLYHVQRGVEIESVYASVVLLAHGLYQIPVGVTAGAEVLSRDVFSELNGPLVALLPWLFGLALVATYGVAWVRLRRDPTPEALLLLSMAAVAAFIIAFKALPTHYLLWLCPMAAVTLGRARSRTVLVTVALCLALGLGAAMPIVWDALRRFDPLAVGVVVARNLAIVSLFVLLLQRAWPRAAAGDRQRSMRGGERSAVG
jgi:hypothetical protein